jgi:hypothetical protein
MTSYPNVTLPNSVIIQPQITSNAYKIADVTDDPIGKTVIARVIVGEKAVNFFTVWSGDSYDNIGQWTDQQLQDAVTVLVLAAYPSVS